MFSKQVIIVKYRVKVYNVNQINGGIEMENELIMDFQERLSEILTALQFSGEKFAKYIDYFNGKSEGLPSANERKLLFRNLKYEIREKIEKLLEDIKISRQEEFFERFIDIMLHLGEKEFYDRYRFKFNDSNDEEWMKNLFKSSIPKVSVITYVLESVFPSNFDYRNYCINKIDIELLDLIYERHENLLVQLYNELREGARLFVGAYLVSKEKEKYTEITEHVIEDICDLTDTLFVFNIEDDYVEQIIAYINGDPSVDDSKLKKIAKILDGQKLGAETVHILLGATWLMAKNLEHARRFIKMMVLLEYQRSFDALWRVYGLLDRDNAGFNIMSFEEGVSFLNIPHELYILWLVYHRWTSGPDEGKKAKEALITQLKNHREVFEKTTETAPIWDAFYLRKLIWEQSRNEEDLWEMENDILCFLELFFLDNGIPQNSVNDLLEYLEGKKDLKEITMDDRKGLRRIYSYGKSGKEMYFFHRLKDIDDLTPLWKRILFLFIHSGNSSVVELMVRPWCGGNEKKYFETILDLGADMDGMISIIADYACNKESDVEYKAKKVLEEQIEENPGKVLKMLELCSTNGKIYLMEELFDHDPAKNYPEVLKFVGDPLKAVREKAIKLLASFIEAFDSVAELLKSDKPILRETAIRILGSWNDQRSRKTLIAAMETEEDERLRKMITDVLNK